MLIPSSSSETTLLPWKGSWVLVQVGRQCVLNLVSSLELGTEMFFNNYFASPVLLLELRNSVCWLPVHSMPIG